MCFVGIAMAELDFFFALGGLTSSADVVENGATDPSLSGSVNVRDGLERHLKQLEADMARVVGPPLS
jgi:hypothetical protein